MKKFISVILCLVILASSVAISATALEISTSDWNKYPVILVPGYSSTVLINTETGEQVWGLDFEEIGQYALQNIAQIGAGLGALAFGDPDKLADLVGEKVLDLCEQLRCNPDGTSVYPLVRAQTTAEQMQYSTILEKFPNGEYQFEPELCAGIAEYVGNENIYVFNSDFRMGSEVCAGMLNDFVESVKAFTGKDKVNIFAISHGGQTTSSYINIYGHDSIANAVLTIPAIAGAGIALDAMRGDVKLDEECLVRFVEYGTCSETDFNWLVKAEQLGFLDKVLEKLVPYLIAIVGYWGSMWDFIPVEYYEEVKALRLDETESAKLIETHDRFHYDILPNVTNAFRQARADGANVSIIAGTGNSVVTGLKQNSDGIITTASSTGATCAPLGERFADGYTQINDCDGKYKVNPSMTVDASTAYLPDHTWFVEGYYHGMTYFDYYTRELMYTLLLTDKIEDVYSCEEYPQFHETTSPSLGVYAEFEGCLPGYIDSNAKSLKITNCSWESSVIVQAVTIDGIDLTFNVPTKILAPGESMTVTFKGDIPEVSKKEANLNICFLSGTVTPQCYRTQGFTVMNGEDYKYEGGYVKADSTALDNLLGDGFASFLKKLGLNEYLSMIFNIFRYIYLSFASLFA